MIEQRKRVRRAEARPEEILEAALAEFTERGFDAARVEDIARRAGISKGGVYLYFPSKEALLKALIEAKIAPIAQQAGLLAKAGAADPLTALRMLARIAAERLRDPTLFAVPRLVIGLAGRFPEIADFYRMQVAMPARVTLEQLIESAIALGQIRKCDVKAVARAFIGPLFFEAMWTHVLQGESALGEPEKLIESQFDILLNGLELRA
jgi:AcrR family transcriptional regulator